MLLILLCKSELCCLTAAITPSSLLFSRCASSRALFISEASRFKAPQSSFILFLSSVTLLYLDSKYVSFCCSDVSSYCWFSCSLSTVWYLSLNSSAVSLLAKPSFLSFSLSFFSRSIACSISPILASWASNSVCNLLISSWAWPCFSFSLESSSVDNFNSCSSLSTLDCKESILSTFSWSLFLYSSNVISLSFNSLCKLTISSLSFAARDFASSSSCLTLARSFNAWYNSCSSLETFSCFSANSLFISSCSSNAAPRRSSNSELCFIASNNFLSAPSLFCWSTSKLDLMLVISSCRPLTSFCKLLFSILNISTASSLFFKSFLWDSRRISCSWTRLWRRMSSPSISLPFEAKILTCCSSPSLIFSVRWSCVSKVNTLFLIPWVSDLKLSSSSRSSSSDALVSSSAAWRVRTSCSRTSRSSWLER